MKAMKNIKQFVLVLFLGIAMQISAQETTLGISMLASDIENFELPTFSKLSTNIATDYNKVIELLPDLSTIGPFIDKEIRRGFPFEHSTVYTVRNLSNEHSILPNISPVRFQLRNVLNNIMFTGFDINQQHCNDAYRGGN
jgi:hypothetical protein